MGMINVDTSVTGRLTPDEGKLLVMAEHFDEFVVDWEMSHPSVWRDRLPKGTFPLYQGSSQKTNIFRGTLGPQEGLNSWNTVYNSVKPSGNDAGQDACQYNPQTYTWAYDTIDFTGYRSSWRSPAFCVNDMKYIDKAREQLQFIIRAGSQVTDATKETFNREMYVKTAVDAGKGVLLVEGGMDYLSSSAVRFSYNPFTLDADGHTYVTFAVGLLPKLSTLNWTFLDYIRQYMADQCPDASMATDSGMPIFGLMIDLMDFERMVYKDNDLREDFRFAKPQQLISGFNMGFKTYRGFWLIHDPRQMRFRITSTTSTLATATRVVPRKATTAGTVGYIPETNPEYIKAEIGMGIIFMSEVISILVPPTVSNLGSGMVFGPAPDYNGEWTWLNIQDAETNPLREIGYFFARFEYYVKPLRWANEATVFLYRRCTQSLKTGCDAETASDASDGPLFISTVPVAADFSDSLNRVTLTLTGRLTAALGDAVNITNDASAVFAATVVEDSDAPTYTFAWVQGGANTPTAVTEINDTAITKVAVV